MQAQLMGPRLESNRTQPRLSIALVIACWIGTISAVAFVVTPFV